MKISQIIENAIRRVHRAEAMRLETEAKALLAMGFTLEELTILQHQSPCSCEQCKEEPMGQVVAKAMCE
jgi:hypothetical protein